MDKIKAIIFDMDGVMFDTERLYSEGFAKVARELGHRAKITDDFILGIKGMKKSKIDQKLRDLLGESFDCDECWCKVIGYIDDYMDKNGVPVKDGLFELIKLAKENNIKVAIGTSETEPRVRRYLLQVGIPESTFDALVFSGMVKNGKPAPDVFLLACEKLGVNPKDAIVLEDSYNGILAAHRAGTKPVMVVDCIKPTDEIRKMLFVEPLESLRQVKGLINNE